MRQEYSNWYAIYVDDASPDGTADLVREYIKQKNLEDKITLIANKERKGALANHYIATHMCDDWDIVIQYDGDDWFAHDKVLPLINELYDNSDTWLTYGSFIDWPINVRGYSKPTPQKTVEHQLYRETYWTPGQLRTFYAWVFKKIKLEDLLWDHEDEAKGKFYPASCDLAFSYPMMEMVGNKFKYVDDIIYVHNVLTPLNDFKVNRIPQIIASNVLLYKNKYNQVTTPPAKTKQPFKGLDVMVVSLEGTSADAVTKTINSCKNLAGVQSIFLVDTVNKKISNYDGTQLVEKPVVYKTTKELLVKELHNWWKSTEFVFFIEAGLEVDTALNLPDLAQKVDATEAFGFFPSLGINKEQNYPAVELDNGFYVWRLCYADQSWLQGNKNFCVLCRKEKIRERIAYLSNDLVDSVLFDDLYADGMLMIKDPTISRIGLSFDHSVVQ